MSILDEIFANRRLEVDQAISQFSLASMRATAESAPKPPDFLSAIRRQENQRPRLIAEVKKASPSRGVLMPDFDPLRLATTYRENGASAISVLTDQRYFMGSLAYLESVAAIQPKFPVLRKDFIFHPYQIYEARAAGASAVLLIAAMLETKKLCDLRSLCGELGLSALVEVHNQDEVIAALTAQSNLIGVNNRDLHNFKISLETTFELRAHIPSSVCMVSESGISTRAQVDRLQQAGVDAILVGEALVTSGDIAAKVRELAS